MAFDDKFCLSIPIQGYTTLSLNKNGTTIWGDTETLEEPESSRCFLHYGDDQKIEFANVNDTEALLIELVNALHDKEDHQVVETIKGKDFPYRISFDYDIHWPC